MIDDDYIPIKQIWKNGDDLRISKNLDEVDALRTILGFPTDKQTQSFLNKG